MIERNLSSCFRKRILHVVYALTVVLNHNLRQVVVSSATPTSSSSSSKSSTASKKRLNHYEILETLSSTPFEENNLLPPHFHTLDKERIIKEYSFYLENNNKWSNRVILEILYHSITSVKKDYSSCFEQWTLLVQLDSLSEKDDNTNSYCDWCGITCGSKILEKRKEKELKTKLLHQQQQQQQQNKRSIKNVMSVSSDDNIMIDVDDNDNSIFVVKETEEGVELIDSEEYNNNNNMNNEQGAISSSDEEESEDSDVEDSDDSYYAEEDDEDEDEDEDEDYDYADYEDYESLLENNGIDCVSPRDHYKWVFNHEDFHIFEDDPNFANAIVAIDLSNFKFVGTLPMEISQLTYLQRLNLRCNRLRGTIPNSLGKLINLRILDLSFNEFSGSVPRSFGNLINLKSMLLEKNKLEGTISRTLFGEKSVIFRQLEAIDFSHNTLSGTIHDYSLAKSAPSLKYLYLNSNCFTGQLPRKFFAWASHLESVFMDSNKFTGTIPSEFASKDIIKHLILNSNLLEGIIPKKLLLLPSLLTLALHQNRLSGSIPNLPNIATLEHNFDSSLQYLNLQSNLLQGKIPWNSFRYFRNLEILKLSKNSFSGTISDDIALYLSSVSIFDVSYNRLTGKLPSGLGDMALLSTLNVTGNLIVGAIPENVCSLSQLNYNHNAEFGCDAILCPQGTFHMNGAASNHGACRKCILFTPDPSKDKPYLGQTSCNETHFMLGDIDGDGILSQREILRLLFSATNGAAWGSSWQKWKSLSVHECHLPGIICKQGKIAKINLVGATLCAPVDHSLSASQAMMQDSNDMPCFIPSELGHLQSLQEINFSQTRTLKSTIPTELGLLTNLQLLNMSASTSIYGTIPSELGDCAHLRYLYLDSTNIVGTIPSSLGLLRNLEVLRLGFTSLTGTIPSTIGNMKSLKDLFIANAGLTGTLPSTLSKLSSLESVELFENQLTGTLPILSGNRLLKQIDVFDNKLSGKIPSWIANLQSMQILHLKDNQFSGTIPSELGVLRYLSWLDLAMNSLSGTIPSEIGNITSLKNFYIVGNKLTGTIPAKLCENYELNEKNVALYGCQGISCPIGTYTFVDEEQRIHCILCSQGETTWYLGSSRCVKYTQRDFLEFLYHILNPKNSQDDNKRWSWKEEYSSKWMSTADECDWAGVSCDENYVMDGLTIPLAGLNKRS